MYSYRTSESYIAKEMIMQCLCDQLLFMRRQDPDDLPFKAGEELMVVSKVRIVTSL